MNAAGGRPVPDPDATPLLDDRALAELEAFGPEFLAELIVAFDEQVITMLADIDTGLSSADAETERVAAHTMKGSAATMGLGRAAAVAANLEALAKSGDLTAAEPLVAALREALDEGMAALRARAAETAP